MAEEPSLETAEALDEQGVQPAEAEVASGAQAAEAEVASGVQSAGAAAAIGAQTAETLKEQSAQLTDATEEIKALLQREAQNNEKVAEAIEALKEPITLPSSDAIRKEIARVKDLERLTYVLIAVGAIAIVALLIIGGLMLYNTFSSPDAAPSSTPAQQQGATSRYSIGSEVTYQVDGVTITGTVVACPGDSLMLAHDGSIMVNGTTPSGPHGPYSSSLAWQVSFPGQVSDNSYLIYAQDKTGYETIELVDKALVEQR